jgi:phosphoribosylamine-glycine ligase
MVVVDRKNLSSGASSIFSPQTPPCGPSLSSAPPPPGARLEGSKAFSKKFMDRHHIPTAAYREFNSSNYAEGIAYLQQHPLPIVLKADGLAAGKGV